MVLVGVILVLKRVVDLANHIQVRAPVLLLLVLSRFLDKSSLLLFVSAAWLLLLGEIMEVGDIILLVWSELGVPFLNLTAAFMIQRREKGGVIVGSVKWFSTKLRNSCSFDCNDSMDVSFGDAVTHGGPESEWNGAAGVIDERDIFSDFLGTLSEIDHLVFWDFSHNTAHIEGLELLDILDFGDVTEFVGLGGDGAVIFDF